MNLFADESVDRQIVDRLRRDGHRVPYVAEMEPGISDDIVLERANRERAVLMTADKDFGELVYRLKRASQGVVLLRLAGLSPERKAEITSTVLTKHGDELVHTFTVVSSGAVRIRRDIV